MCTPAIIAISSIFTLFILLALITIFYAFYIICNNDEENLSTTGKILRYTLMVASTFMIAYYPIIRWQSCIDYNVYLNIKKVNPLWFFAFGTQIITLNIIFFNKIVGIFTGTSLEIKKIIQNIYKALFIFLGTLVCVLITLIVVRVFVKKPLLQNVYSKIIAVILLLSLLIMISLTILFIRRILTVYKVYKVATKEQNTDDNLIGTLTKATVLIIISTSITFIHTMTFALYTSKTITSFSDQQLTSKAIGNYLGFFDIYSNFAIAMLFFRSFGNYYREMCGCIDRKCRICWLKVINKDSDFNEWQEDDASLQYVEKMLSDKEHNQAQKGYGPSRGSNNKAKDSRYDPMNSNTI